MSLSEWRQFPFYEVTPIRDPASGESRKLYSDPDLSSVAPVKDHLALGYDSGRLRLVDRDLKIVADCIVFGDSYSVTRIVDVPNTRLICTIGEKQGHPVLVKLWDFDRVLQHHVDEHKYHSVVSVTCGRNQYPISAFSHSEDFTVLAFGYANGTVILVRGDIIRDRGSRQRAVYESPEPITGLFVRDDSRNQLLYVTTTSKVITVGTSGRNQGRPDTVLENTRGCDVGCAALVPKIRELVVAREDGITYYTPTQKTAAYVFDSQKRLVYATNKSAELVIVSAGKQDAVSGQLPGRAGHPSAVPAAPASIGVFNTRFSFVGYTGQVVDSLRWIFELWGDLYVLGTQGVLYRLREKPFSGKIAVLLQRHLYELALSFERDAKRPESEQLEIRKQYADYLYSTEQFAKAAAQYIRTIPLGNSNEVILRFRDSQHVQHLTAYLEALLAAGKANKDHATLLLNCYCKAKQVDKLEEFTARDVPEGSFDLYGVIELCRQSQYFQQAYALARKYGEPGIAVDIQLRDLRDARSCLAFVRTLDVEDALRILIQHAHVLLDQKPNETTALLIEIFTGKYRPGQPESAQEPEAGDRDSGTKFPVLQSYRAFVSYMSQLGGSENGGETLDDVGEPRYHPPRPRIIFPSFINRPNEFVIFLEACVESYDRFAGNEKDKLDILTTLVEMYLSNANLALDPKEKAEWEQKAKKLGESIKGSMDTAALMLLFSLSGCDDGEMLARDQAGYQIDMFRACCARGSAQDALEVLKKYGSEEPELYRLALGYFVSRQDVYDEIGEGEVLNTLKVVKEQNIMQPLEVVEILASSTVANVGLVKEYLMEYIEQDLQEIENYRVLAENYRSETEVKEKEIHQLLTEPRTVQNSHCNSCGTSLDLPVVHFACGHSYHQRCVSDGYADDINSVNGSGRSLHSSDAVYGSAAAARCPRCLAEFDSIKAIRQAQENLSERNDLFQMELEDATDKFKVITDFLSRGVMKQPKMIIDS